MTESVKMKTETYLTLHVDKMFGFCPYCGKKLKEAWQPTQTYDESNHVRYCPDCDTAWVWRSIP